MYTICINGAPGSGKTTMGNYLLENEDAVVIHLDQLLERLKKVLPDKSVNVINRENEGMYTQLDRNSLIYKFIHLKYVNGIYTVIKNLYLRRELVRLRDDAIKHSTKYFIVEGVDSNKFDDIFAYDYKIFVRAEIEERGSRVAVRDYHPNVAFDFSSYIDFDVTDCRFYDIIITNYCSFEDYLKVIADLSSTIKSLCDFKRILENRKK